MGPENGVLALGNTVETNKHRKRETWRLLVRSRRKGPERAYQMVAVKDACSTGVSRQTSQTQFKPLPSKQSMAKDDRTGMEISLPLLVFASQVVTSHAQLFSFREERAPKKVSF